MVKLMTGMLAIFASLSVAPSWYQQPTAKAYEWIDHSTVTYKQLQKTQHCYAWVSLGEEKQKSLKQDRK